MAGMYKVRIHETIVSTRVREIEIEIPAKNADLAGELAQTCYPDMLPPDVGIRVISDNESHERVHQAGAGIEMEKGS